MTTPFGQALEWATYWIDVAVRLWVLGLLLSAVATAVAAATTNARHPLQPRHEWSRR